MTPMLLSAFWTYTLITALTPGPNNILALSAATAHGFRQSIRVLAGMSLGFLVVMLLCAGIAFSLAVIDPAIIHLLSWVGAAYILWLAWKIATSPAADEKVRPKPVGFWVSFGLQFVNVQNYSVRHYRSVYICFTANAGAELGHRRQYIAGIDRHVR